MAVKVSMKVNGKAVSAEVEERTLLVTFIREHLRLTGTHVGCDTAQCGACTVHMNGSAVKSCSMLAMQAEGADITTIEGLAKPDGTLHPMQAAFKEYHGLQCGFCTPGHGDERDRPREEPPECRPSSEIREALEGNLCRCTGYHNIVKAIGAGARGDGRQGGNMEARHGCTADRRSHRAQRGLPLSHRRRPVHRRRRRCRARPTRRSCARRTRTPAIKSINIDEGEEGARRASRSSPARTSPRPRSAACPAAG